MLNSISYFILILILFLQTPDTVTIHHIFYTTTFSKSKHYPVVVKYWLTKKMYHGKKYKRTNKFIPDPKLSAYTNLKKDYSKSGYDQGHQMAAEDCAYDSIAMIESFYYSNMAPQTPALNRGEWKSLETYTRNLAKSDDSVLVWCGSVSTGKKHIGKVSVPDYCWKIIYVKKKGITEAYSFRNNSAKSKLISAYRVSVDSVYHLSGIRFMP